MPQLVALYNKYIAKNPRITIIHVSGDSNEKKAVYWAAKGGFSWLTVRPKDYKKSQLFKYASNGVPHYAIINKKGSVVAYGKKESFAFVRKLAMKKQH